LELIFGQFETHSARRNCIRINTNQKDLFFCGCGLPGKISLEFGKRLCLEPSDRRGRASTIKGNLDGKEQPFRISGGTAAINPNFKDIKILMLTQRFLQF
jgi:hypothetical protein